MDISPFSVSNMLGGFFCRLSLADLDLRLTLFVDYGCRLCSSSKHLNYLHDNLIIRHSSEQILGGRSVASQCSSMDNDFQVVSTSIYLVSLWNLVVEDAGFDRVFNLECDSTEKFIPANRPII